MRKKKERSTAPRKNSFNIIITIAMLFLSVFMVLSAVSQFRSGRAVSGSVSVLGAILFLGLTVLQIMALVRQLRSRNNSQEDQNG